MPSLPPPRLAICELTPTTAPLASSSGPPELPGLIAASVWMTPVIVDAVGSLDVTADRRDDAARECLREAERAADRVDRVADLDAGSSASRSGVSSPAAGVDLQHGEVLAGVAAEDLRGARRAVGAELHRDLLRRRRRRGRS